MKRAATGAEVAATVPLPARRATKQLSLDVFDTALTRACGPPDALFLWLGRRLQCRGIITTAPEVFARARLRADHEVWSRAGGLDSRVSLLDFQAEVVRLLGLPSQLAAVLAREEQTLEREVMRAVPHARDLIRAAEEAGIGFSFCSDTYLDTAFVRELLSDAGLLPPDVRCFVSSAYAASKASGALFEHALAELGVAKGQLLHGGDHPHSDVTAPARKGIPSFWIEEGRLNRYEHLLSEAQWETSGIGAALAGSSRIARLTVSARTPREIAIRDVSAGVAAPLLIGYVLWLLDRAEVHGLKRLFFLARDGQVLAEIAERLVARLKLEIEIHYLYVSRLSTNLAATFEATEDELGWVFRDLGEFACAMSLDRLGLCWEDVEAELAPFDLDPSAPVPERYRDQFRAVLSSPRVSELICRRAEAPRRATLGYLQQEGLFADGRSGIIDIGGVGSQVRALHGLATHAGSEPPRIFLVGLDRPEDAGLRREAGTPGWLADTECYLYDDRRDRGMRRFRGLVTCFQMFCAASHGTVEGYEKRVDGSFEPRLSEEGSDLVERWGLPLLHETVLNAVEGIVLDPELVDVRADLREATCRPVRAFWREPTQAEARAWGQFPFEGAQAADAPARSVAVRYSGPAVLRGLASGDFPDLGWQHWYEGSLRLSSLPMRKMAHLAAELYRRLAARQHPVFVRSIAWMRAYRRG